MLSCPNCGGNLKFDIPSQQLSCEHCHTLFDPYDFDGKTSDAEESKTFDGDYEVTIFTCPQCGGEILSTDQCRSRFLQFLRSLHDSLQQNQSRKTAQLYYSVPEDKGTV